MKNSSINKLKDQLKDLSYERDTLLIQNIKQKLELEQQERVLKMIHEGLTSLRKEMLTDCPNKSSSNNLLSTILGA